MSTSIKGYPFDGDPDGLKFLQLLNDNELKTIRYCVDYNNKAHIRDQKNNHLEITKSNDGTYMVAKIAASSGWW